jgi:penicillin-binding protein 2
LIKAIKRSVDTYYYQLGLKLGINYIAANLRKMGFGKKTGIDLPNEKAGIVPDKMWKLKRYHQPWFIGETLNAVIGQGYFLATPLQVAANTALLASGKLPKPFVVKYIDNNKTKPVLKDVLNEKEKRFLPLVRKGMWEVCNSPGGTATRHLSTKIEIAGKTGTAQVYSIPKEVKERKKEDELAYFHRSHAWLTTYGPYKNPQVVVTVLIEHGGHGGEAAGSIVSAIYNFLLEKGYIK